MKTWLWAALFLLLSSVAEAEEPKYQLGLIPEDAPMPQAIMDCCDAPLAIDWRPYMPPVRDQGACGSCVAFGALGAVEGRLSMWGWHGDLSEADLFFCGGANCQDGWYATEAFDYLENPGVVSEAAFEYQYHDPRCKQQPWYINRYRVTHVYRGGIVGTCWCGKAFLEDGPVATQMEVYSDFFTYQDGIYQQDPEAVFIGYHLATLVGYDDRGSIPYWIIRNSWGEGWGMGGYAYIAQGDPNNCFLHTSQCGCTNYVPIVAAGPILYQFSLPIVLGRE